MRGNYDAAARTYTVDVEQRSSRGVGELIVLHTVRSGAQPIAEAIDQEEFEEVLGTIAVDTIRTTPTTVDVVRLVAFDERMRALSIEESRSSPSRAGR